MGRIAAALAWLTLGSLACAQAQESLIAHYAIDEGKGDIVKDNTPPQYHSRIRGAKWVKSEGRTALEFDGRGGYLHCGPGTRLGLKDTLTISVWVKPLKSPPQVLPEPVIVGHQPATLALTYWKDQVFFYFSHWKHRLSTAVPPGRWYHVAAVSDGKKIELYIDGQRRRQQALPPGTIIRTLGDVTIGGTPGAKNTFPGLISDVRIYRSALSADRIRGILPASLKPLPGMPAGPWTAVKLPRSDEGIKGLQEAGVSHWQRHAGKVVNVFGTPFRLRDSVVSGARTHLEAKETTRIRISPPAGTVYLLMAVHLPRKEPGRRQRPYAMSQASCPHRLSCELALQDGSRNWIIPLDVRLRGYHWTHGVGVYALESPDSAKITEIALHDKLSTGALGVLAATASSQPLAERPTAQFPHYVLEPRKGIQPKAFPKPKQTQQGSIIQSSDGIMSVGCDFSKGLPQWTSLGIRPLSVDNVLSAPAPMWDLQVKEQGNSRWQHATARVTPRGFEVVSMLNPSAERCFRATLKAEWAGPGELILDLSVTNAGLKADRIEKLMAPIVSNVVFGSLDDTWYWFAKAGGIISNLPINNRDAFGVWHPLQADGFFSPAWGWGLSLTGCDTEGVSRYFITKKDAQGCAYGQEYPPCTIQPGETKRTVPISIRAMPGDWKAQFSAYKDWLSAWWRPASPPRPWFRRCFSFTNYCWWAGNSVGHPEKRNELAWWAERWTNMIGAVDLFYLYGWPVCPPLDDSHDGSYRYDGMGGLENFRAKIAEVREKGFRVGLYINGYLVHTRTEDPRLKDRFRAWQMFRENGKPRESDWGKGPIGYMCPSQKPWRDYLINHVYKRIHRDLGVHYLYVDQYGSGRINCFRPDHGHEVPADPLQLEITMLKDLRAAMPDVALFTEYTPADVMAQYVDGAYGHVAQYGREDIGQAFTPHLINLQRFAFPHFKNIDYVRHIPANGNLDYRKVFLFNAEILYLDWLRIERADAEGLAWMKNVIRVLKAYEDAFASDTVEPLVRTLIPGVYANRFEGKNRTVWTFYNANPHSVDAKILSVPAKPNVTYYDAYYQRPVRPTVQGDRHLVGALVWPQDVGCLVREEKK